MKLYSFIRNLSNTQQRGFIQNVTTKLPNTSNSMIHKLNNDYIKNSIDYDNHEAIFYESGNDYLFMTFIHNTNRGMSQGGARFYNEYNDIYELIDDGLRLSKGMTYKNSLAGLNWGGGKGIIYAPVKSQHILEKYGQFISSLNGCYYTAEDVGLNTDDIDVIYSKCRYTTCISEEYGGSGNPSAYTARGVVTALDTVLKFNNTDITNLVIGIEGLGNVGSQVLKMLLKKYPKQIFVSENNPEQLKSNSRYLHSDKVLVTSNLLDKNIDIYIPCAMGNTINTDTIDKISAKIICGAANNQLEHNDLSKTLHNRGIIYVPDYLINRMGIVNCSNEMYGHLKCDYDIEKHFDPDYDHSIPSIINNLLSNSDNNLLTICDKLANNNFKECKTIRPKKIIEEVCYNMLTH